MTTATRLRARREPPDKGPSHRPSLRVERALHREGFAAVAGIDEVGRGALCGPVSAGVVLVRTGMGSAPQGVRDSKLLTPAQREALAPRIRRWAAAYAVGHASSAEIDALGLISALRLAGHRALAVLPERVDVILLDGNHDYLTPPEPAPPLFRLGSFPVGSFPVVRTLIKADLRCSAVAAASILAKTARDALMVQLHDEHPEYGWATNRGYGSPDHLNALRLLGPTAHHRVSWNLPLDGPPDSAADRVFDGGPDGAPPLGGAWQSHEGDETPRPAAGFDERTG